MAPGGARIPRIYTRTGDAGTTGLAGGGRVAKDSLRIAAFGTLDELGSNLGLVASTLGGNASHMAPIITRLQHEVFVAQSELAVTPGSAMPKHLLEDRHVRRIEGEIDELMVEFDPVHTFVLPGGTPAGAALHVARTVARRAEREIWALHRVEPVRSVLLQWVNRVSDLLFALALSANRAAAFTETPPDYAV